MASRKSKVTGKWSRTCKSGKYFGAPYMPPDGKVAEDYALVSRIFHSESGVLLILAAGLTQFGSQAAGMSLPTRARSRKLYAAPCRTGSA